MDKTGRELTRLLNGMNQRMEAAFLLLKICPQCGTKLKINSKYRKCVKHGLVSRRTKYQLFQSLEPWLGSWTSDPASEKDDKTRM